MARLKSIGQELNTTTSGIENTTTTGSPTIVTSPVISGTYTGRISSLVTGTAQAFTYQFVSSPGDGPYFVRFSFMVATLPSAENRIFILNDTNAASTPVVILTLDGTGALALFDEDGQIGSDSSALSVDVTYRIEIEFDRTPAAGSEVVRARLDGTEFAGSAARSLSTGVQAIIYGGNLASEAQTTGDWFFDNFSINDSTGSFQTSYPGPGEIIVLRPGAAGDNNQLGPALSTNYQQVDEITPDATTTEIDTVANATGDIDDYDLEATPVEIGTNDTITCVQVEFVFSGDSATQANNDTVVIRIKASSGGTVEESAGIQPSATAYVTNSNAAPRNPILTLYDLPGASTAVWTKADLDAAQIGVRKSADSTSGVDFTSIFLTVDHIRQGLVPTRTLLGVGL